MAPIDVVLNALREVTGQEPKPSGRGWSCLCPAHDDRNPSLSVSEGNDGRVLVKCMARNCDFKAIAAELGLKESDFFGDSTSPALPPNRRSKGRVQSKVFDSSKTAIASLEHKLGRRTAAWTYRDRTGRPVGMVIRWDTDTGKEFRPIALNSEGWTVGAMPAPRLIYQLDQINSADASRTIVVVEGEKAAEAALSIGLLATTSPGGSNAATQADWTPLAGRSVAIIPDNDEPGAKYARQVANILLKLNPAAIVRMINLADDWPQLPAAGDIADWCDAHEAAEPAVLRQRVDKLIDAAPALRLRDLAVIKSPPNNPCGVLNLDAPLASSSDDWPTPPTSEAFYGLAGKIVRRIEPHSEADPVALLVSFLMAFGNLVGRTAYFQAEASKHHLNLFAALVGTTSKGRKGSSWNNIRWLCSQIDEVWTANRITTGLSSGEGFIFAVRDAVEEQQAVRERGRVVNYEAVQTDAGVDDKRLLVIEEEFASVLMVAGREGNILSPRIREAWDSGNLATMTKKPIRATGAHVSILGHVTRDELRRNFTATEQSNGFGNRFLWVCVKRSKCLPEGGQLHETDFSDLLREVASARDFARAVERIERDDDARTLWANIYPGLSEGKPGLTGAMLGRAEAQVMRIACLYAMLDRSFRVRIEHLNAALAVWDYCQRSTRHIFGNSLGNKVADEISAALISCHPEGLTRTDISHGLFQRNKSKSDIDEALRTLREHSLAHSQNEETDGRTIERWFAAGPTTLTT